MNATVRYLGQFAAYALFAALIGYFAQAPDYVYRPVDSAEIKLSFSHGGQKKGGCRQLTAEEIAMICRSAPSGPGALFVPSRSGLGTNGALLTPPEIMPLKFGEPSFQNHLAAARARGIEPVLLPLAGLGLDIDDPEDLRALIEHGEPSRAGRVLQDLGLAGRLAERQC